MGLSVFISVFVRARKLLPFSLCLLISTGVAADELSRNQLEFYLIQSFSASTAAERISLNHIGVEIEEVAGNFRVSASLEGYPAHAAGIERGDVILRVNDAGYHPVYSFNKDTDQSNKFIADQSSYSLEIERNGSTRTAELTPVFENLYDSYRTAVENSLLKFSSGNKVIGYLRLWGFSRSTNDLIVLSNLMQEFGDCDGLILDLRNSYGYLSNVHLDFFLARPARLNVIDISTTENSSSKDHVGLETIPLSQEIDYFTRPIAILINEETRGGGELLTYALDGLERIMSIGQTSSRRIGQYTPASAESNSLLYVPEDNSLSYGDSEGKSIENEGVTPEYFTDYPIDLSTRSDPQYESAVSFLLGTI